MKNKFFLVIVLVVLLQFWVGAQDDVEWTKISNGAFDVRYGYIDKNGKVVIPFKYERARTFLNDHVMVRIDKKWIKIDKEGNEVSKENEIEDYDGDD